MFGNGGPYNRNNDGKVGGGRLDLQKCFRWEINKEVTEWMSKTKLELEQV